MTTSTILYAALTIGLTGLIAAVILYFVSKFFKVEEDPRIDEVQACLPGANCGGCGFAGCGGNLNPGDDISITYEAAKPTTIQGGGMGGMRRPPF